LGILALANPAVSLEKYKMLFWARAETARWMNKKNWMSLVRKDFSTCIVKLAFIATANINKIIKYRW